MNNKIIISFLNPPIPIRNYDYCAYRDPEGDVGFGRSEQEAINMLKELENIDVPERESAHFATSAK